MSETPGKDSPERSATRGPIGVFDSGVGGLSILRVLKDRFPEETFVYLADTAHMPYGSLEPKRIRELVLAHLNWMSTTLRPRALVIACNTADMALRAQPLPRGPALPPLIGPIEPTCRFIARSAFRRLGILATVATVKSGIYPRVLRNLHSDVAVKQVPARGMARLIEMGEARGAAFELYLEELLRPLLNWKMDALLLGCTHYPHIRDAIAQLIPPDVALLDPAQAMASALDELLSASGEAPPQALPTRFWVTGDPLQFAGTAAQLMPEADFSHVMALNPVDGDYKMSPSP